MPFDRYKRTKEEERAEIINKFMVKLKKSGYNEKDRREIAIFIILSFQFKAFQFQSFLCRPSMVGDVPSINPYNQILTVVPSS